MIEKIKSELKIFIHNLIIVVSLLFGWDMIFNLPDLLGNCIGGLLFIFGLYLLIKEINVIIDKYIDMFKGE